MGWVMMSERELNRIEVLAQVDDGRLTVENAANLLHLAPQNDHARKAYQPCDILGLRDAKPCSHQCPW
jgi:hypothetical protein